MVREGECNLMEHYDADLGRAEKGGTACFVFDFRLAGRISDYFMIKQF